MTYERTKRPARLPLVQLNQPGVHNRGRAYCDFCATDAVWFHFADKHWNHNHFACNEHVQLLNDSYACYA